MSLISNATITLVFLMWWHMLKLSLFASNWHYKILKLYYLNLFIIMSPLWKSCGLITSLFISLCEKSHTQEKNYHIFNTCSIERYVSRYLILCMCSYVCLVINLSYHICIYFIFNSLLYNVLYSLWLSTSYTCTFFMLLVWTYH